VAHHKEKNKQMPETWKYVTRAPYFCVVYTFVSKLMFLKAQELLGNAHWWQKTQWLAI